MRSTFTRRAFAAVAAVATTAALATPVAGAQSLSFVVGTPKTCEMSPAETEQVISDIYKHTNIKRAEAKVGPVERLDSLEGIAQDWSTQMADEGEMYHNPQIGTLIAATYPGQTRHWSENVLQNWCGASGEDLVNQWMNSAPHRINLLRSTHTHIGVGVAGAESGKLYATQNYVRMR